MRLTLIALLCAMMLSCTAKVEVKVSNPSEAARTNETVELAWGDLAAKLSGMTAENVVVLDGSGKQVPSQVIFNGADAPASLIFQVNVDPKAEAKYAISTGKRDEYTAQAFGRFVPERMDDYAWENNLVAFRLYGPALKDPNTPGIDVWSKGTEKLIIDEWYAKKDYHHNYGEGMDCYKVGPTLGCGGSTPFVGEELVMCGKYITQKTLDNGPLRTSFELTYGPFVVGADTVTMTKVISLDANTHFSKMTDTYFGKFAKLDVAAGIIMHDTVSTTAHCDYVALTEWASDSKTPEQDGQISCAVIMPESVAKLINNHLVMTTAVTPGTPMTYWAGAGWSGFGVKDAKEWNDLVYATSNLIEEPLTVSIVSK